MKLRKKKTGEIIETVIVDHGAEWEIRNMYTDEGTQIYDSLAELNSEWEDYEEPKEYYCIDWTEPDGIHKTKHEDIRDDFNKEIGNYFDTREEAEQTVEKLKAWKRLKDKGFRFVRIIERNEGHRVGQYLEFEMAYHFSPDAKQIGDDLDLLFSGEDD